MLKDLTVKNSFIAVNQLFMLEQKYAIVFQFQFMDNLVLFLKRVFTSEQQFRYF